MVEMILSAYSMIFPLLTPQDQVMKIKGSQHQEHWVAKLVHVHEDCHDVATQTSSSSLWFQVYQHRTLPQTSVSCR